MSQCLRVVSIFEITWNLNYFLNIFINYNVAPEKSLVFDGYGASFLYLYSAAFGIPYALLLPQKINFENNNSQFVLDNPFLKLPSYVFFKKEKFCYHLPDQ